MAKYTIITRNKDDILDTILTEKRLQDYRISRVTMLVRDQVIFSISNKERARIAANLEKQIDYFLDLREKDLYNFYKELPKHEAIIEHYERFKATKEYKGNYYTFKWRIPCDDRIFTLIIHYHLFSGHKQELDFFPESQKPDWADKLFIRLKMKK